MKNTFKKLGLAIAAAALLFTGVVSATAEDKAWSVEDEQAYQKFLKETDSSIDY